MRDGQVLLIRHHGELLLGRFEEGPRGKLHVLLEQERVVRINPQQVVLETDAFIQREEFPAWRRVSEELARGLELQDLWEVVRGAEGRSTLDELTELYWGGDPDVQRRVAMQLHLASDSLYFTAQGNALVTRSSEEVAALRRQRRQEEEAARDERSFLMWLTVGEPAPPWTVRQLQWLEQLKGYAVHGNAHPSAAATRRLLQRLQPRTSNQERQAFAVLVERGVFQEDEPLGLYRRDVPVEFPPEVLRAAEESRPEARFAEPGRRDLTGMEAFTIDEESTRDMDDALSLEETPEGYLLGIHITDASALVPLGGVVDAEAARRMTSIYLPERWIPMLPPRLTEERGSLRPGQVRLALSVLVRLDHELAVVDWEVTSSIVRSRAKLSYQEADRSLTQGAPWPAAAMSGLRRIAVHLREERIAKGALELSRPEVNIRVDSQGRIKVHVVHEPGPSRRLVAEFMVLANRLLAEFCQDRGLPAIYRAQDAVDIEDLRGIESAVLWSHRVLRRLRTADLDLEPRRHALLGVSAYLQATSPLRRYPDLVMQRQMAQFITTGEPAYDSDTLAQVLYQAETRMGELGRVEQERKRYWLLKYVVPQVGDTFMATVLDVRHRDALVELAPYPLRANLVVDAPTEPGDEEEVLLQDVDLWRLTARVSRVRGA